MWELGEVSNSLVKNPLMSLASNFTKMVSYIMIQNNFKIGENKSFSQNESMFKGCCISLILILNITNYQPVRNTGFSMELIIYVPVATLSIRPTSLLAAKCAAAGSM